MFITFEGIEGSGKSTQIQLTKAALEEAGYEVVTTKEPGGTPLGSQLRKMILDPETNFENPFTELLLFYADRLEHLKQVVEKGLNEGKIILCDRYVDSTYAYQVGGRHMPEAMVADLNKLVSRMPRLTLLFDLDPKVGLERIKSREALDRFETIGLDFHQRVRATYLDRAKKEPNRIHVIDVATKSIETLSQEIKTVILAKLQEVKEGL